MSAHLIRAEDRDSAKAVDFDLKSDDGTVCSGAPDQAKGVTPDQSLVLRLISAENPVFPDDRMQAVLDLIRYPWQDLGYDIVFKGPRLGYRAMTLTGRRKIEVYVRPGETSLHQAYDLAHELGHAFDLRYNDEKRRRKWCQLRGIDPSTPWFGCDACPDYGTPAGDFAETFAYLLLGPGNFHSMMAALPKHDQLEELATFCKIEHLSENLIREPSKGGSAAILFAKAVKKAPNEAMSEQFAKTVEENRIRIELVEQQPAQIEIPEQSEAGELRPLIFWGQFPEPNQGD